MTNSRSLSRASKVIGTTLSAIRNRLRTHPGKAPANPRDQLAENTTPHLAVDAAAMEIAPTVRDGVDFDAPAPDQAQTAPMNQESGQEPSKADGSEANVANNTGVAKDKAEHKVENTEDQKEADEKTVAGLQYVLTRIESEAHANAVLRDVIGGKIGFDTEFTDRRPTPEEKRIEDCIPKGALRKAAILGWQIVELHATDVFPVAWNNVGVRLIQIARDNSVWVLDMWKIRAVPTELVRILTATDIEKTGGGLTRDITLIWDDLRIEMRNLVDVGMMTKLLFSEKYPKMAYGNLALKTCVEEVLGYQLSKDLSASNWKAATLEDAQIEYAGLDAIVSVRLYEVLVDALARKSIEIGQDIPTAWYTFNSKLGEPTRTKLGWDGAEIAWRTSDCTWYGQGKFIGYP
ncbi:ribonuclease H-like domain-containing protein [Mycena vulgaris]|nr:ribonuclease H-like domain-containing protein [Mycena vulgaris]